MEDRSSQRLRTLVTRLAGRGLSANEIAGALISMMAGSNEPLQSEAGYIDARPPTARLTILLATHGRTIHSGQARRSRQCRSPSAHTSATDNARHSAALRQLCPRSRRLSICMPPAEVGQCTKSLRDSPL